MKLYSKLAVVGLVTLAAAQVNAISFTLVNDADKPAIVAAIVSASSGSLKTGYARTSFAQIKKSLSFSLKPGESKKLDIPNEPQDDKDGYVYWYPAVNFVVVTDKDQLKHAKSCEPTMYGSPSIASNSGIGCLSDLKDGQTYHIKTTQKVTPAHTIPAVVIPEKIETVITVDAEGKTEL